jgi:23S rRNA (guanosine2251-2'-O)-methyltransferase
MTGKYPDARQKFGGAKHRSEEDGPVLIYGVHAVSAVIANPAREIRQLFLTDNAEHRMHDAISARNVKHERVHPRDLDRKLGVDAVHQGALVETMPLSEPSVDELVSSANEGGPLVILDQVTDPHNVGAILRSAAVFGASGLIMTRRNSPPLAGALAKASSGALEAVPVALVTNLARTLGELGDHGVLRVGLDGEGDEAIGGLGLQRPLALVLGSEGKGLRRLTRELCDKLVRIGATGTISSLNVSTAAAVALYAVTSKSSV